MRALRGGQVMTESLGINPFRVKLITFVIAALLSALSGWLYAHMSRFVSPAPFDVSVGILYLLMAMVGGRATSRARSWARPSSPCSRTASRTGCR